MPGYWHNKMELLFPEDMREVKFLMDLYNRQVQRLKQLQMLSKETLATTHHVDAPLAKSPVHAPNLSAVKSLLLTKFLHLA